MAAKPASPFSLEKAFKPSMSANFAVATLNTGMVGGSMGLSFWHCFAIITSVNVFSCLLPAWTATFGLTGLRMTTFSRYSFGYWGNLLVVVFSMVSTTGWNAINSISEAPCLYAVSDGKFPQWAGVMVISTTIWIICALGITWIHRLDAYLWIPPFIVWCVAAGTGAKSFDGDAVKSPTGANGAAAAFSFIAVTFSFAVSWINCAADYNVKMPVNTARRKIFIATYVGICNNIPDNYSFAIHAQNFGPWALRVPRIAFITFGYIAAITVGCCAAAFFEDTLQTFLSIIGYWTIIHLVVIIEEHIVFRHACWQNYDWDAWYDCELLPFGWGAIAAFAFSFLGAAFGMKVAWYTASIAGLIGKKGGNVGHELTALFCGVTFPILRYLEKRYTGK
ncbi:hypothetical protein SLS61_008713 [Didymella pomorum]